MECEKCLNTCIKKGIRNNIQRYYCRKCNHSFQDKYIYQSYKVKNSLLVQLLKEGLGIRSISRILQMSKNTVSSRIINISKDIRPPFIFLGKEYEVDELCTYIGNKSVRRWIAYSLRRDTKEIVNFVVGTRSKLTLNTIVKSLLLSNPKRIYTDKLNIYKSLIPNEIHITKQYSINHIERMNLTLRTHLKRLNRKTICYSKNLIMLTACLKIYFWG